MPRLIDADALEEIIIEKFKEYFINDFSPFVLRQIRKSPTIEAEPVRHGYWKPVKLTRRTTEYKCSICGRWERTNKEPYCNCGAKMDGGIDRDNEM